MLGSHWCVPYANWVAKGIFDFVVQAIDSRNSYRQRSENDAALSGFSSCLAIPVALLTETSLKTLLVLEEREIRRGDVWGHDLWSLYGELSSDSKAEIRHVYDRTLPTPFDTWKNPEYSLEDILRKERHSFERWRYLADYRQEAPISNPYSLLVAAYAIYSVHVDRTDLPTYPEVK